MQIVIDIPEEDYEYLKSHNKNGLYNAILNGTPLPKGHGRLIDEMVVYKKFYCRCLARTAKEVLDEVPTIIDANKERE